MYMQTTHKLKKITYSCTHPCTEGNNPVPFICGGSKSNPSGNPKLSVCKGCDHCITSETPSSIPCTFETELGINEGRIIGESKDTFTVMYSGSKGIVCEKSLVKVIE